MTNTPNEYVRQIARTYCYHNNLELPTEGHYVKVNEQQAREIAAIYDSYPTHPHDQSTALAYYTLKQEIRRQFVFASRQWGIQFLPYPHSGQPYANSQEMCEDVANNKRLFVFEGGDEHPSMDVYCPSTGLSYNVMFRAIHDLFGHAAEGYQFGPRGEHNAWIHHSMMFSHQAQKALTTETRGQNSWVNYGPYSHLPVCERPYAPQKAVLLPEEYCDWRTALRGE